MQINVNILLSQGETLSFSSEEAAVKVLQALDGNDANDYCMVYVQAAPESGEAGKSPVPSAPPIETPPPSE